MSAPMADFYHGWIAACTLGRNATTSCRAARGPARAALQLQLPPIALLRSDRRARLGPAFARRHRRSDLSGSRRVPAPPALGRARLSLAPAAGRAGAPAGDRAPAQRTGRGA